MDARTEREKRLADALRQNLHRRKAQGREAVPAVTTAEDVAVTDGTTDGDGSPDEADDRA